MKNSLDRTRNETLDAKMTDETLSPATQVSAMTLSFLTFGLIYLTHRRTQPEKGPEWSIRLVTMIHAAAATSLAYFSCFVLGPWPLAEPGLESNSLNLVIISISLGYFLLDYLWCLRQGSEKAIMHVHHWFSLIYLSWGSRTRLSGAEIVGVIFGSEITNPMLQLRWMLRRSGKYETTLGSINDILFAAVFIFVRCVVGAYFLYCVLSSPLPTMAVRVGGVVFYAISAIFGFQIARFARRRMLSLRRPAARERQTEKRQDGQTLSQTNVEERETDQDNPTAGDLSGEGEGDKKNR